MGMIFISHSSRNNGEAIAIRDWLLQNGWGPAQIFLDLDAMGGGDRWRRTLDDIGSNCEAVIVCLSDDWIRSPECTREFTHAESRGKPIFPIIVAPISEQIPRFVTDIQFVDVSDPTRADAGFEKLKFGLNKAQIGPNHFAWPPPTDPARAPYRGLKALQEEDAAIFFGRDAQITAGLDALRQMRAGAHQRILTIAAASGAGKSSFLKAGLLARLRRDEENFIVLPTWRPGRDALSGDTGLLKSLGLTVAESGKSQLSAKQEAVIARLGALGVADAGERPPPALVLPLDQTEELFSADNESAAEALEVLLASLADKPDLLVVATIRSDSLGALQADARIASQLNLFNLPALPPSAFKEVIEGPAALARPSIRIEPALTERLIEDLDRADALPLLAFTLERLVADYGADNLLELAEYESGLGGVSGAINAAVEAVMRHAAADPSLPSSYRDLENLARIGFIPWLVQLEDADSSPKRRVAKLADIPSEARQLLQHFIEERLITSSVSAGQATLEVSHEAVLRHWTSLSLWIAEERDALRHLTEVISSARAWRFQSPVGSKWRSETNLTTDPRSRVLKQSDLQKLIAEAERIAKLNGLGMEGTNLRLEDDGSASLEIQKPDEWLLHRGQRLAAVEKSLAPAHYRSALGEIGRAYLEACRTAEDTAIQEKADFLAREEARLAEIEIKQFEVSSLQMRRARTQRRSLIINVVFSALVVASLAGAVLGFRQLHFEQSKSLSSAALMAESDGQPEQALVLATLAADGDWLRPASADAELTSAEIAFRTKWWATLDSGSAVPLRSASFSPDGKAILAVSSGAEIWRANADGVWSSTTLRHGGSDVLFGAISNDSQSIALTFDDATVMVWPTKTDERSEEYLPEGDEPPTDSELVGIVLSGHESAVNAAAFSPDDSSIVTGSHDKNVRVWHKGTDDAWTSEVLEGHQGSVLAVAFSPDGQSIVSAAADNTARVWHLDAEGVWTSTVLEGHSAPVYSAIFSPDGQFVVTTSADTTTRVWRPSESGDWTAEVLEGHKDSVYVAAVSSDGRIIATASRDKTARVWARDADAIWTSTVLDGHQDIVRTAAFSPDGTSIVTASDDQTARTWRADRAGVWKSTVFSGHESVVRSAAYSPDGQFIVSASDDRTARIWRANAGGAWISTALVGHKAAVESASFSPDSQSIVTTSLDFTARTWRRTTNGMWASSVLEGLEREINHATYSPDGMSIITTSYDGIIRLWREGDDKGWTDTVLDGHVGIVNSAAFSHDAQSIVTSASDNTARIWRAGIDGAWSSTTLEGHEENVVSATFSPDDQSIVTTSWDETARVWREGPDGAWTSQVLEGHTNSVTGAAFSPDGQSIVTSTGKVNWSDKTARVWQVRPDGTWSSKVLDGHKGAVTSAVFSPDGQLILTGSDDGTARVWTEDENGTWSSLVLKGHKKEIVSAAFSPDGLWIVTASYDGTARLWRVGAENIWPSIALKGHTDGLASAAFSPDGRSIVTAAMDGTARIWNMQFFGSPILWGRNFPTTPAREVCKTTMSRSLQESFFTGNGYLDGPVFNSRIVRYADAESFPMLEKSKYKDVCKRIIAPRPSVEALAFWQ